MANPTENQGGTSNCLLNNDDGDNEVYQYNKHYSILQRHVEFFDRNKDGVIYPWETFQGFRRLGFNIILSFIVSIMVNIGLSYATLDSWIPNPLLPIYIRNIHRAKHGSDTEIYDSEGCFLPSKFEDMFSKFAKTSPNHLSFTELWTMTQAFRNANDPFGWFSAKLEWTITYWLVKNDEGFVPKDAVKGVYDGSIFYYIENQLAKKSKRKIL